MATKPTETLNFETTAVVAIPNGKQTTGFVPGERPPAQYFNWLFRILSRLYNYVKDGQFTGDHSIDGELFVTSSIEAEGNFLCSQDASIQGDFSVGGQFVTDIVMSAGKKLKDGTRTRIIPLLAPEQTGPITARSANINSVGSGAVTRVVDIPTEVGRTITAIRLVLTDSATGPSAARFRLFPSSGTGGGYGAAVATSNNSSGAGVQQTISATGLNIQAAASTMYTLIADAVSGSANISLHRLEVDDAQL